MEEIESVLPPGSIVKGSLPEAWEDCPLSVDLPDGRTVSVARTREGEYRVVSYRDDWYARLSDELVADHGDVIRAVAVLTERMTEVDDIARLLGDLTKGRLTAAVPLLDLLRERGLGHEAGILHSLVGDALDGFYRARNRHETLGKLAGSVRYHFWHLMPERDVRLRVAEKWLEDPS